MGPNAQLAQALQQASMNMSLGNLNAAGLDMQMAVGNLVGLGQMLQELQALQGMGYDMDARNAALAAGNMGAFGQGMGMGQGMGQGQGRGRGQGPWRPGPGNQYNQGSGGPGRGSGQVGLAESDVAFDQSRVQGQMDQGAIVARFKVPQQEPIPGEALVQFESLRTTMEQQAEDTVRNERIPLEYRKLIEKYFDVIKYQDDGPAQPASPNANPPAAIPPGNVVPPPDQVD
jgi:hypothetical protein